VSRRSGLVAALTLAIALTAGCGGGSAAGPGDRFDAERAFGDLRAQVDLGPRPAGSAASRLLAERLREQIPRGRFESVPGGLRNVVGHLPGRGKAILVGAHYDTKDVPGFVGANDGASGTATVLELSRALRAGRRACDREIRFVLFDGEESPQGSDDFLRDALRGSRAYARAHARGLSAVIVVDFVGDKHLSIPREASSDPALWELLRAGARRAGTIQAFPGRVSGSVLDDHTPFQEAGVRSIDLIDFTYPYFHRPTDTLDKVSAASLDAAGEALVEMLRELASRTCRTG
jgi:glutaminyl-peptide cyclotransferase